MRKAAAGLPHSKLLLRKIMGDSAGTAQPKNAFDAVLAKIRDRDHFLLVGYVAVDLKRYAPSRQEKKKPRPRKPRTGHPKFVVIHYVPATRPTPVDKFGRVRTPTYETDTWGTRLIGAFQFWGAAIEAQQGKADKKQHQRNNWNQRATYENWDAK